MILQALYEYEQRRQKVGTGIPTGCGDVEFKFLVEIDSTGRFHQFYDMQEEQVGPKGKSFLKGKRYFVPDTVSRTSGVKAKVLWDNAKYLLGAEIDKEKKIHTAQDDQGLRQRLDAFIQETKDCLKRSKDRTLSKEIQAIINFYENPEGLDAALKDLTLGNVLEAGGNLTFRLIDGDLPVPAQEAARNLAAFEPSGEGVCLITGQRAPLARIHSDFLIRGGKQTGASLVSCQKDSGYDSYYKEQGYNAPVSQAAAFDYASGLKQLLASEKNKAIIGKDTYVFWSVPKDAPIGGENPASEGNFRAVLQGDPDKQVGRLKVVFDHIRQGTDLVVEKGRFCLLGLTANSARIAVRLWRVDSTEHFAANLRRHLEDTAIDAYGGQVVNFPLDRILWAMALDGKIESLPPNIPSGLLSSVVDGVPYPLAGFQRAIVRIRAEQEVRPELASLLRGTLNRWRTSAGEQKEVFGVKLDDASQDPSYVLGRVFSILESIQRIAQGELNKSITSRFLGAAASTPGIVFPKLFKLSVHHLQKISQDRLPRAVWWKNKLASVMEGVGEFPRQLNLYEQGKFFLGYYHQNQDVSAKKEDLQLNNDEERKEQQR